MKTKFITTAAAVALLAATGAASATPVTATTDLNLRAGPGPQHPVVGVIGAGEGAELRGCIENSKWCIVASADGEAWAYSDYLTADLGGQRIVITERPADSGIVYVPAPEADVAGGAAAGAATGAVAGAIVGGPVGAAVGGAAGGMAGGVAADVIDPPAQVRTYVTSNTVDPVYLDGEVVVGASLPDTVVMREIPDYQYRYVYVNGQPVLVEPDTRRIVYVVR